MTFGVASLSYYLVEMPIRHGALPGWRIKAFAPAAVAGLVVILLVTTAGAKPEPRFAQGSDQEFGEEIIQEQPGTPAGAGATRVLCLGDSAAKQLCETLAAAAPAKSMANGWSSAPRTSTTSSSMSSSSPLTS